MFGSKVKYPAFLIALCFISVLACAQKSGDSTKFTLYTGLNFRLLDQAKTEAGILFKYGRIPGLNIAAGYGELSGSSI